MSAKCKMICKSMTQLVLILLYASISGMHWGRRDISGTSFRHDCWPEKDFNEITGWLYCLSHPFSIQAQSCFSHCNWKLLSLIFLITNPSQAQVAKRKFTLQLCGMQSRHTPTGFFSGGKSFFFVVWMHRPAPWINCRWLIPVIAEQWQCVKHRWSARMRL